MAHTGMCSWEGRITLKIFDGGVPLGPLPYTRPLLQLHFAILYTLDQTPKIPTLSQTSYLPEMFGSTYPHSVFNGKPSPHQQKVAMIKFTFISENVIPYFGLNLSHHLAVSRN